ncbi:hypothetical protein B9Z19DRAFT_842188 [Tuber borchii]|uniref:Uncharacterized protein n=1 Tax=Tuber borchii TaxID=42251 RepID=A0A2T6ZV18_TUBBO|nr:hypothetical protein B9Z19DRAFT_842188 [Tuber borchii]
MSNFPKYSCYVSSTIRKLKKTNFIYSEVEKVNIQHKKQAFVLYLVSYQDNLTEILITKNGSRVKAESLCSSAAGFLNFCLAVNGNYVKSVEIPWTKGISRAVANLSAQPSHSPAPLEGTVRQQRQNPMRQQTIHPTKPSRRCSAQVPIAERIRKKKKKPQCIAGVRNLMRETFGVDW